MMEKFISLFSEFSSDFNEKSLDISFTDLEIDSFDLLELRSSLEERLQSSFEDSVWIKFNTPRDIYKNLSQSKSQSIALKDSIKTKRSYKLNMPQMALGGLGESWLMKEIGDSHWSMITNGLNVASDKISDKLGNRLYATFVRIRYKSDKALFNFYENEQIDLNGEIKRYGKNLFLSDIKFGNGLSAELLSSFVSRSGDNSTLMKGEVEIDDTCKIPQLDNFPAFSSEYKQIRKSEKNEIALMGEKLIFDSNASVFQTNYKINPYFDFNGVNLLYFAAYPMISDQCEREYFNSTDGIDWAIKSSTLSRDIYYFSNCDVDDTVNYVIRLNKKIGNKVFLVAEMFRQSDEKRMALIATCKEIKDDK